MNKKKLGLLIIVLFLIIGLGSFVFANPDNQENFEKGEIEERDRLNGDSDTDDNGNTDSEKFESDLLTGGTGSQSYGNKNILFRNNLGNYDGTWFTTGSSNNGSQVIVEYDYYADALKAVQNAESSLAQGDVDYAISLIDQVTNQSQKDELNSRLEAVQDIIDVTVLIERLETMVANSTNRDGIDASIAYRSDEKIEELVTNLTNGSAKDNLANRLKTVNKILNDNEGPVISGIDNNSFTKEDVSLTISDENEVTTTVKLNDKEVDYADPFTIEGVYAVTVVDKAFNETTLTFTIDKTLPVIEGVEDGNRYTDSVTPIITDTNLASVTLNGEPFTSGATISEKGEHTLVVTDKAGNDVTVKFTVAKLATSIDLIAPESLVYDGKAKEFTAILKDENDNVLDIVLNVVYEKEDGTRGDAVNAGKYTAIVYFGGNDIYEKQYVRKSFEITKADTEFEFIAPESLMYDGTIKEYTAVLKDQHGNVIDDNYTVVYEKEDGTRGDAVNAGKYTVIAHYAGNENYNGTYKRENFEIIKATPTIELTEPTSLVYDGTAKSYGIKVIGADGNEIKEPNMVVIYRKGSETIYNSNNADKGSLPVDATSYTLGIYVRENDNYTRADKWINFEIIKADTEFEFIAPESFECDGSAKEYTVVLKDQHGNVIDDNYTVVYEKEDGTRGDALNIGKYTVIAHYAGNENYNGTYRRENFELIDTTKPVFEDAEATMESDVTINVIDYNLDRIQVTNKTTNETYEVENGHKLTEEGFYRVIAYDKAGNKSDVWNLTIDNVAPVITIENARESGYYNHDVVVKISDIELQQTYLNGERVGRTDTLTIEDEGTYTVYAEDRYGHKSEEVTFTIDRTKPVFEDAEATMKFDVSINVTEDNLDKILVTDKISGETYEVENGHILTKEGYYKIMAYDKAGNKSDVWNLTIDNVAPVITIENARESGYYNHDVVVKISDIELQQTYLNGERVGRTDTLTIEDEGTYTVYAEDRYGHKSEEVTFTIDKSIPTITVDKLENGVTDDGNVTVEDNGEFEVIVKYNGVEKVITTATTSKRFSISWLGEGNYEVIVTDLAGNTKTVNFELNYLNLIDQKVGANLIDEANNTINNFNSFAIKFNNDITITNYSATNGFKIEYEYSTDGKNYTKSTDTVISNYWTGALGSSTTEKYQGSTFTIKAGEPIYYSGTKVGERWNDIYEAIKSTKDTENEVYVRVVFTVIQPTYTKSFTLDPVVYSQGGYEVTPRGLAEF